MLYNNQCLVFTRPNVSHFCCLKIRRSKLERVKQRQSKLQRESNTTQHNTKTTVFRLKGCRHELTTHRLLARILAPINHLSALNIGAAMI